MGNFFSHAFVLECSCMHVHEKLRYVPHKLIYNYHIYVCFFMKIKNNIACVFGGDESVAEFIVLITHFLHVKEYSLSCRSFGSPMQIKFFYFFLYMKFVNNSFRVMKFYAFLTPCKIIFYN